MRKPDILASVLIATLVGLYFYDFAVHGLRAMWPHIVLVLITFIVRPILAAHYSVDIVGAFEAGERDYHERIRGEDPAVSRPRLARVQMRIALFMLIAAEAFFAIDGVAFFDPVRHSQRIIALLLGAGALIFGAAVFGVIGAARGWVRKT